MLEIDLNEQIKKHLPAQVGDVLKARLELADKAEELQQELEQERERHKATRVQGERLAELSSERFEQVTVLTEQLKEFKTREDRLKINEAVLATKLELTDKHRTENLDVVKAVFQNNRIKYREFGQVPVMIPGTPPNQYNSCGTSPFASSEHFEKNIEQET